MKKILILTAGFGEGHNAAARGLQKALEENFAEQADVAVVDLVDLGYPELSKFVKKGYGKVISHAPHLWSFIYDTIDSSQRVRRFLIISEGMLDAMHSILRENEPDIIVSTYPAYGHQLAELQKRYPQEKALFAPYLKVVTDSITINRVWIGSVAQEFVVPNVETGDALVELGVPRSKINENGFPVNPAYARTDVHREPLKDGMPTKVLMMLNTDSRDYVNLAQTLGHRKDVQLTVTVGKRPELEKELKAMLADSPHPADVLGWVDDVPALMLSSHVLIGKAGGATVQEAIAAKLPMVVAEVLPGQEEGNALLLKTKGVGKIVKKFDEIPLVMDTIRVNNSALWNEWQANLKKISRPDAAIRLAEHLMEILQAQPAEAPSTNR